MDEQTLRNEIDVARATKFPDNELELKKATLRDTYYKAINELKVLAINSPEDKKEDLIQRILAAAAAMENLENEIIAVESDWVRPADALITLDENSLFSQGEASVANLTVGQANFINSITLNGSPVLSSIETAWPVGSIFISMNSTNPGIALGFGVWFEVASGKMLVGIDAADPDFSSPGQTGGSKTHTLLEAEMPVHTHVQNPHTHRLLGGSIDDTKLPFEGPDAANSSAHTFQGGVTSEIAVNQSTGGGQPHSNMPPYFVVYVFTRES